MDFLGVKAATPDRIAVYSELGGGSGSSAIGEEPTGTVNGVNTAFTLSEEPPSLDDLRVTINGVTRTPTVDYTFSGTTLTFTFAPASGSEIFVWWGGGGGGGGSYTLPIASATVLGGIKVGTGLSIDGSGVLSSTGGYTLPTASASVLGGVKVGSGLSIDGAGVLSSPADGAQITGTPVDNQIAVWTSATNIEGTTGLTWDGTLLTCNLAKFTALATGTKLIYADAVGTLGAVTLGTRLSFTGTTLNVSGDENSVQTLTNKRITPRVTTITSSATPTPDGDNSDMFTITALAANAVIAAPTGTPTGGQRLVIRIKDNGTARTLGWNAIYRASTDLALPTTTTISKVMYCGFIWNATDSLWDFIALNNGF